MAQEKQTAVSVKNLTKVFVSPIAREKIPAVVDLSFEIKEGQVYGLIGPNGSGKSTTMKVILGLVKATSGSTSVFGVDSGKVGSRRDVGFLPENPYFYKHLTGTETLRFYGKLCGLSKQELKNRVPELLKMVALEGAATRPISGYSKGMLQRIGLAQALIHEPRLVVLDEPTAGVDPRGSRQIRDLVLSLKEQGKSVILSSHLLEQVQEVCDQIGIIYKGRMVKEGTLKELIELEEQTELTLENASPKLLDKIEKLVKEHNANVVSSGKPRTTLERLFLEETKD